MTANITSIEDKQKTSLPKVEIILREWNCLAYPNDGSTFELNSFVFPNTDLLYAVFGYMLPRYQTALIFRIPTWDFVHGVWGSMTESWMFSSELSGPKCFPVRINPKVWPMLNAIGRGWTMCEALDRMLSAVPNDIIFTSMTDSIEAARYVYFNLLGFSIIRDQDVRWYLLEVILNRNRLGTIF